MGSVEQGAPTSPEGPNQDRSVVQSVQRAAAVLEALAATSEALTVQQLAREVGLDRTVVHRLVRTLAVSGLVEDLGGSRYQVGPGLLSLGTAYLDRLAIRRAALPFAVELQMRTIGQEPWVVSVAVPARAEAILVDRLWSPRTPLDSILDVGTRLPIDRSATGRCMLAYCDQAEVEELLGRERAEELAPVLEEIRAAGGIEVSSNERRPGISAMAACVRNRAGRACASVIISGPELGEHLRRDSALAETLNRTAASIGTLLP